MAGPKPIEQISLADQLKTSLDNTEDTSLATGNFKTLLYNNSVKDANLNMTLDSLTKIQNVATNAQAKIAGNIQKNTDAYFNDNFKA